jgi:hypothetical protein
VKTNLRKRVERLEKRTALPAFDVVYLESDGTESEDQPHRAPPDREIIRIELPVEFKNV